MSISFQRGTRPGAKADSIEDRIARCEKRVEHYKNKPCADPVQAKSDLKEQQRKLERLIWTKKMLDAKKKATF